jgi:hypothetical protein
MSTNHGRYSTPGPAIGIGNKPGKASFVPIFVPQKLFSNTIGEILSAHDKDTVQKYLLNNIQKVFTNPY